ncbi:MAG: TonB family protein [Candidatus Latescibacterota bacterium]
MTSPYGIQLPRGNMRNALLISLAAHLIVGVASMEIVRFRRVKFVPRQVYTVQIISGELEKPATQQPKPSVMESAPPEQVTLPPQDEEMKPPPEKPKNKQKKTEPKHEKKEVPTTELQRIDGPNQKSDQEAQPATGDLALDVEDFPFAYYIAAMKRKIAAYWRVPGASGTTALYCRVYFRVGKSGGIDSPSVEESSGSFLFDQAALRAVVQSSPLPPLPREFNDDYLGVHFSFAYEKR